MSRRASSRGDRGKAPIYATFHGDFSSNDETISTAKRAAQVLQSHFNRGGDDTRPISEIPMEIRSRRRRSAKTVRFSFESRTISSRASSWRRLAIGEGPLEERRQLRIFILI
ncbi:hypothetical protein SO802_009922 [Lithocarpus litseifolius]|uniref:Uncharacterized protein n=1 Tax=Lithocarpus litseifolius TaxID=425828 RepID=A0AAW2DGL0_9ROSI